MPPTHLLATAGPQARPYRRHERSVVREARAGGLRWIAVVCVLIALAGGGAFLGTWPPLATVMSASMAPTINTGDVVVLKQLDAPAAVGEVVMVNVPDEARARYGYPPVVIHRVVSIAANGQVRTKGDAKKEADPFTVPRTAITTRVLTHIPAAGQLFGFLSSSLGLLWLVGGAVMLFGLPLLERYRDAQRRVGSERDERELVLEELRVQVELLPRQIERAVANAVAGIEPPAPTQTAAVAPPATVAAPPAAVSASTAGRPDVFAVPPTAGPAPAPRIIAAAKLAAVAAMRLAPRPAPVAPDAPTPPPTRTTYTFTPVFETEPAASPAPPVPGAPAPRLPVGRVTFTPVIVPSSAFPAALAPDAPTPKRTGTTFSFAPVIDTLPQVPAAPAPPDVPNTLPAGTTFSFAPVIDTVPAASSAPPVPDAPAPRLPAVDLTFAPVVDVRLTATPAPPAPAVPASRFPAAPPAPVRPVARFSRLVPASQRTRGVLCAVGGP